MMLNTELCVDNYLITLEIMAARSSYFGIKVYTISHSSSNDTESDFAIMAHYAHAHTFARAHPPTHTQHNTKHTQQNTHTPSPHTQIDRPTDK